MRRCCAVRAVLTIVVGGGLAAAPSAGATDFSDRDLLVETLTLDEQEPLAEAKAERDVAEDELALAREAEKMTADAAKKAADDLAAAEKELEDALAEDPQDPDRVAAAQADLPIKAEASRLANEAADRAAAEASAKQGVYDQKVAAVEAIEAEIAKTGELVGELSAKQVHDLNASLQNARKTGLLPLDLDSEHLQAILDGAYGTREIHALTNAYEQEARFDRLAMRFVERYDATGREHFQAQAERFAARGDEQKEKFLEKIERFTAQDGEREARAAAREAAAEAREAAREAAAEERGDHGRHLAKGQDR
jgi:hypothetical protein